MVGFECFTTPANSFLTGEWAVNGTSGGSARHGTIVENADPFAGNATYTAPATKPTPNVVAVSAVQEGPQQHNLLLVASVTILDDAATCDRLSAVEHFDAEVSFDSFDFSATAEDRAHAGDHQGRLRGRLTKVATGPTFGFWTSAREPLQDGFVRINDQFSYSPPSGDGYSGTFAGSGAPVTPSLITLKIDYATCTFDLHTAFAVEATSVKAGDVITGPLGIGILYLHDQAIPLDQLAGGTLEGTRSVPAGHDIDVTNYIPVHDVHAEWSIMATPSRAGRSLRSTNASSANTTTHQIVIPMEIRIQAWSSCHAWIPACRRDDESIQTRTRKYPGPQCASAKMTSWKWRTWDIHQEVSDGFPAYVTDGDRRESRHPDENRDLWPERTQCTQEAWIPTFFGTANPTDS